MTLPHSGVSRTHITHTQTKLVSYQIDAQGMMDKKIRYERIACIRIYPYTYVEEYNERF